jgi:sialate O-acetylesterase
MERAWRASLMAAVLLSAALGGVKAARAAVRVPAIIGDHMVVERGQPVRLWGRADPGEVVRGSVGGHGDETKADATGRWRLALPALAAGGPYVLTIEGSNKLTFSDVWAGEVWLASGQSNMELPLARSAGAREAASGGCAGLHLFTVATATAALPKDDVEGAWKVCDAETAAAFSAVAFHFGREVHRALGLPVGLIHASWGGTPAEAWTPREALVAEPALKPMVEAYDQAANDAARKAEATRRLADWEAHNFQQDAGNKGEAKGFARPTLDLKGWAKMDLPRVWEDAGLAIDGAVWFRREIDLPAAWAGQDLALSLGPVDDFDVTYWNGERVGATGADTPQYWSAPRRYPVPGRLVHTGRNVIAVRVFDHFGNGGFPGAAAQMTVAPAKVQGTPAPVPAPLPAPLPLAGPWLYKIEKSLKPIFADFSKRPKIPGPDDFNSPSVIWNGMIAPIVPFPVAGVIWYQGESNVGRSAQYHTLFPTLIRAWRAARGAPALPFLFVQLPGYEDGGQAPPLGQGEWAELREAQAAALQLPGTGMAVAIDVGEPRELHPRNKQDVGRRLALQALAFVYHKDVIATGPVFRAAKRQGAAIRVRFASVAGGLVTADGAPPRGFMLAGADRTWHAAEARIEGDCVVLTSPEVAEPLAVRYAWGNDPPNSLRNQADLPAAPFRSDDWPVGAPTAAAAAPAPTPTPTPGP